MNNRKIYFESWHGTPLGLISYAYLVRRRSPAGAKNRSVFAMLLTILLIDYEEEEIFF